MKQILPTTNMAIILLFCHLPFAFAASVQGISSKDIAAESNNNPNTSSSYYRLFSLVLRFAPAHGDGERRFAIFAFRMFKNSANASGRKATGRTIVHIP